MTTILARVATCPLHFYLSPLPPLPPALPFSLLFEAFQAAYSGRRDFNVPRERNTLRDHSEIL